MSDFEPVIRIINAHDEDDAESAEADYQHEGVDNQFVYELDEKLIGVTGYRAVPATKGTYWLSWTYLLPEFQGKGYGKKMLSELFSLLREKEARKLFVKVSDYKDETGVNIYESAFKTYQSLNFIEEVVNNDFYDEGENQHILSLSLSDETSDNSDEEIQVADEKPVIQFSGLMEIAESDGAYTFNWEVQEKKKLFGKRNFTVTDLLIGISAAKESNARNIFLTFPSNLPLIHKPLQAANFKYVGNLKDYYEKGVHEYHFVYTVLR